MKREELLRKYYHILRERNEEGSGHCTMADTSGVRESWLMGEGGGVRSSSDEILTLNKTPANLL